MRFPNHSWALMALLGLCFGLIGCGKQKPVAAKQVPFHLYFTCDTNGRIEPCGCFTGQYGGLTRVSTVLKSAPAGAFRVEVGNAIAGLEDYHIIQYRHLLKACATMSYSAVSLGEREARLPASTLHDLAKTAPLPLLCANLIDAQSRQPLLQPSTVATQSGLRVGFIGVVDPSSLKSTLDESLALTPMREAIRAQVEALKDRTDILVCLAFTDESGLEDLAREFYECDLILGGDVRQPSSTISQVNQSWILATTNQARALGEVHGNFNPTTATLEQVSGDVTLMVDTIAEDPAIRAFSTAYRQIVRDAELTVDQPAELAADRVPGVQPVASYVGSQACAACHATAFETWSKSGHAHAFESLVRKDSEADPSCIQCHVVGFGEPSGYHRKVEAPHLTGVGCESCHGPGSQHVALRAAATPGDEVLVKMRPVGQGQCTQCHHGEFSRPFDWQTFWPHVAHGKEP